MKLGRHHNSPAHIKIFICAKFYGHTRLRCLRGIRYRCIQWNTTILTALRAILRDRAPRCQSVIFFSNKVSLREMRFMFRHKLEPFEAPLTFADQRFCQLLKHKIENRILQHRRAKRISIFCRPGYNSLSAISSKSRMNVLFATFLCRIFRLLY